jgi:hypothetical protein
MTNPAPIILLEFNELCPPLLDKWIAEGHLPNFKKFRDASDVFITKPDTEDPSELEPWIQWYSIHTGKPYREHGVFHLTDGPEADDTDIWQMLAQHGVTTGNFCGMNARVLEAEGHFGIPDPWCSNTSANPAPLKTLQDFVQEQVQEYTNDNSKSGLAKYLRLLQFLVSHGLTLRTATQLVRQLASEKLNKRENGWKRAVQLDWLLLDTFRHFHKQYRPQFSSFFINSTAHYQHAYWRHMQPEAFVNKPSPEDIDTYGDAILFGYKNMDRLMAEFFKLEAQGAKLILMTALSQQPFLKYEDIGGQKFYRPRDIDRLLALAGVTPQETQPVMTHQYLLRFTSPAATDEAASQLQQMRIEGEDVLEVKADDATSLYIGCRLKTSIPKSAQMQHAETTADFYDYFYQIEETKSGCHHPDGVLWIKSGTHKTHEEKASILDLLPTMLDYFGCSADEKLSGKSLLNKISLTSAS